MIKHKSLFYSALALAIVGWLFYANVRTDQVFFDQFSVYQWLKVADQPVPFPTSVMEWFPSLLFVIGMSLLSASILGLNNSTRKQIPIVWLVISVMLEVIQLGEANNFVTGGNFEWVDIAAMMFGASFVYLMFYLMDHQKTEKNSRVVTSKFYQVGLLSIGLFMAFGSTLNYCKFPDDLSRSCDVEPIYLSWSRLRQSDSVYFNQYSSNPDVLRQIELGGNSIQSPSINNTGKIYVYGDYLLIVDVMTGVHIFDNSDPAEPEYLGFIVVVGVTDVEVVNQILYLNSFTDLVTLKLYDNFAMKRTTNVLSYPETRGWLPPLIHFRDSKGESIELDKDKGVVIGYEADDGTRFYFWDVEL